MLYDLFEQLCLPLAIGHLFFAEVLSRLVVLDKFASLEEWDRRSSNLEGN
jgi:hypothetical protein